MKTWKKGAVIGGIWGLVSLIPYFAQALSGFYTTDVYLKWKLLAFPAYLTNLVLRTFLSGSIPDNPIVMLVFLMPIFIGALIGSIIGFAIEKYNHRRV